MRMRLLSAVLLAGLALAPAASAASGVRVSLIGQSHAPLAGSPWAYYLRAWGPDGKPWQGAIDIQIVDLKGKKIDGVGMFAFKGSWLRAYIWRRPDKGQSLKLVIHLLSGSSTVATASYRVSVR
jgi:hypothetical protein